MVHRKSALWAVNIVLLFLLTACNYKAVLLEEDEMENGRTFSLEQGLVQYTEGIQFTFADYGTKQCIDLHRQNITVRDTILNVDVHLIYRDSMLYLASNALGYYMSIEPLECLELMAVRVEEYRLFGNYEVTKTHLKPLGDLDVLQVYDRALKHKVTCYGRVRMTETNYEYGVFENRYEAFTHNISVQHFEPVITNRENSDPFDLSMLLPLDIWEQGQQQNWTINALALYELYRYLFSPYDNRY